jgi:transcriptional regulator with XRE-family HTH domain
LRENKNWTQDFVAEQLNVARETISRIEKGKNASYEILCDYSALFDIDVTEILYPRPLALAA